MDHCHKAAGSKGSKIL